MNQTLTEIVETVGMTAAAQLCRAWGGKFLYIPRLENMDEKHPIALTLGLEAAKKLSVLYCGAQINVPAERNVLIELRNGAICKDYQNTEIKHSVKKLGETYGVSRAMVIRILKKAGIPMREETVAA